MTWCLTRCRAAWQTVFATVILSLGLGDEFVLILTDVSSQEEVEALCRRLIESIEQPIQINEQEVFVSASIGIAMAPNDACEATELLRYADIALYEAKAGGRNTWRFYAGI